MESEDQDEDEPSWSTTIFMIRIGSRNAAFALFMAADMSDYNLYVISSFPFCVYFLDSALEISIPYSFKRLKRSMPH